MSDPYAYWREELAAPGCNARDTERTDLAGFYRMKGAATKPDFPVAIWPQADGLLLLKVGRVKPLVEKSEAFWDFLGMGWHHCSAVTHAAYLAALEEGAWADGKPSRQADKIEEPKKEPEPAPAPVAVDNRPQVPVQRHTNINVPSASGDVTKGHNGGPPLGDEIARQVKAESELLVQLSAEPVEDEETAEKIGECVNRLRKLKKQAEAEHEEAKRPWLEGGRAVDAAFKPSITACDTGVKRGEACVRPFLAKKQARLEEEARAEAARKQAELERQAREKAELEGRPADEIEVGQVKPKAVVAKVGGAAGRSITSNARVWFDAKITDYAALLDAFRDEPDVRAAVEKIAIRIANTKDAVLPKGMLRVERKEAA